MGLEWTGDPAEVGDVRLYQLLDRFSAGIHRVQRACAGGHELAGFEVLERQAAALERIGELVEQLAGLMTADDSDVGGQPAATGER